MGTDPVIRVARASDATSVAEFHARVWRETYESMAPQQALEKLDAANRLPKWRDTLSAPEPRQHTLIAARDDEILGLICFGSPTDPAFKGCGEIKHLYVGSTAKRQGIGRRLMKCAFDKLFADGFGGVALAVVHENEAALLFYEKMGGRLDGHFVDAGPIWKSDNLIVVWDAYPVAGNVLRSS